MAWNYEKGDEVYVVLPARVVAQWGRELDPKYQVELLEQERKVDIEQADIADSVDLALVQNNARLHERCEQAMELAFAMHWTSSEGPL